VFVACVGGWKHVGGRLVLVSLGWILWEESVVVGMMMMMMVNVDVVVRRVRVLGCSG